MRGWKPVDSCQRGFALIAVLNVIVILSGIAVVASEGSREGAIVSANLRSDAERRALASSAMALAASHLTSDQVKPRWIPDGRAYEANLFGTKLRISVQDESGRLSLNATDEASLAHAFTNVGIAPGRAEAIAAAIADWRDQDDERRLGGAERADYAAAGYADLPANAPFDNLDELHSVMGVTDDVFRRISPLLSVLSDDPSANLEAAPVEVLGALFGANSPQIAAILARRSQIASTPLGQSGMTSLARSDGVTRQTGNATPPTISIEIIGQQDGRAFRYRGTFRLIQDQLGMRMSVVEPPTPVNVTATQ